MRFLLVLGVFLALACTKNPPSSDETKPDEAPPAAETETEEALPKELREPAPPIGAAPVVKLVDAGEAERRELRLRIEPGSKQQLSIEVRYSAEASVGGTFPVHSPVSLAKYDLTLDAKEQTADDAIPVVFSIDDVSVTQSHEGESKERQKRTKAVLKTMKKLTGSYTVTPMGRISNVQIDVPPNALREVYEMTDNLRWALLALIPTLPEEPVGEGAIWTAHRGSSLGGLHLNELATHELIKRNGAEVQIRTSHLRGGAAQTFKNPGASRELELLEAGSEGSGSDVTWDLTTLAPHSGTVSSKLTTVVQIKPLSEDAPPPVKTLIVTGRAASVPAP